MPNILRIEEDESLLPVFCIFGYYSNIREELVRLNSKKFRIIIVGTRKPSFLEEFPEVYFLTYKNANLLPKLKEKIDYSIVFLSDPDAVKNITSFLEKVGKDRAQTLAVFNAYSIDENLANIQLVKNLSNLRYCLLGEVLSPRAKNESDLSKNIENAILNGQIKLIGNEEKSVFCITLEDALTGLQRLLFGNFRREIFYSLYYKKPQTILESTHMLARVEPETKIVFSDSPIKQNVITHDDLEKTIFAKTGMEMSFVDSLDGFEKGIEKLFKEKEKFENVILDRNKLRRKRRGNNSFYRAVKFSFISFFAGLFLFIFLNLIFFGIGMLYLKSAIQNIESSNFENAADDARKSNFILSIIKPTIELTFDAISTIDRQGQTQQTYRLLRKAGELSEIGGGTIANILKTTAISESDLLSSIASFSFIYQEGQRMTSKTQSPTLSKELKGTYSNLLSLSQVLPVALGFEGERNYLLLFQNNEELRPTGGFVGSVGDLIVENGKIKNLAIHDVYELDGQLKNHIEPPFAVRRYLQQHLYLRDSNFGLDFQEVASKSALIYNLETGREPHAVIAIDLTVLKEILKVSGPINLPSYNVTVDSKNVSQFLQSTIQENFFPGSTQKKDVLNSLFSSLIQRLERDPKFNVALIKLLPDLLEKKSILVAFSDTSIQRVFSANGYAGSYQDIRTNTKMIKDYLYINEANIGVNKVNSLVSRKILYHAVLGQEGLVSEALLSLTNASKLDDYKAYVTFVIPNGSSLRRISLNGVEQPLAQAVVDPQIFESEDFVAPSGLEVEQYSKDGLTHIAFVTTVGKNEKKDILVEYTNGSSKPLANISTHSLLFVKQPGVTPFNLTLTYDYPEGFTPVGISADSYGSNFLEKSFIIDDDLLVEFELQKKQ